MKINYLIRKAFYILPVRLRYSIRRIVYLPQDMFNSKKNLELVPPKGLTFTGSGNYINVGNQFFEYFKKYGNINPESKVLDIGSGIGRMARPFTYYLSSSGQYEGFDIVKIGIDWCQKNITKKYPNFNFKLVDLKNDLYRLDNQNRASEFKFPYKDETFDFVFLTSVFTHMLPEDVENYLNEINRVLKKDKICLATFFLMDEVSKKSMSLNGLKQFPFSYEDYYLMDKSVKEANVAFEKNFILNMLKKHNFEVLNFFQGNWSGIKKTELNEHQDIIIFKKK